ncbi:NAD-dependent epimerase/dehydratase family protein [Chelatococcus sp. GCM10030263]|uniref:NAD-dependent epimerase/dehydratase family protein n=1 Tax=Chelatococcus sp. GCM10030263 TaxID=3273387 RepID=UPI003616B99A
MNVLVTGAAGLIGMALRPMLSSRGHRVVATDITTFGRDDRALHVMHLDDHSALEALISGRDIEAIVHCGAISGPMMAKGEPLKLVSANIDVTALLLDLAREQQLTRFVYCSSISVYGNVGPETITEATPLRPTSVYGATKVACEQLIQGFGEDYGLSGVSLRIGRVYGPYRRANCHLASLIRDALGGAETTIPCDPGFVYHYVYADDVAGAVVTALEASALAHREYNVGSGEALTVPEIVEAAAPSIPDMRAKLVPGQDDVPDVQTAFDISLIKADLGWEPAYSLSAGLAAYRDAILAGRAAA